ncbi:MAG: hypothetical protein JJE47_12395 [Acidimicrobiia bacterium]|nr:hypothetical protein [Acidimicrobiia bacterium]
MIKQGSATVVTALLIASCSNPATTTTTTVAGAPTTSPAPTPTTSPSTTIPTTTTATLSPPTTISPETVGSPAALEALIDEVVAEVGEANLGGRENIPFLDINNPDPIAAMKSIIAFDVWVITTWPDPPMVNVYTVDGSQARNLYSRGANSFFKGGSRVVYLEQGYRAAGYHVASPEEVLSPEVVESLPSGAVAISYTSSSGPFEVRRVDDESTDASSDGWPSRPVVTVIVPTNYGWQVWYEQN